MAANTKRSWQVQEFVEAHGQGVSVNCLALGHKSGRVLVTGGDDKKVKLWAIGKKNCIMSLSGHLSPVECVKFAHTEDMVCAGSQAGALKQWDLEAAKLIRTLTGHKAGIKCIDFHPYGDFLASGSLDTSIKLWDYRKKACIFTYKGHEETVNSIKFSPDGQWITSGGEEGKVKIWDLRAGRVLKELDEHSGAVTDVEFHPQEFLLASSSADRSVSFWDLENFHLVSKTEKETALIRCLHFSVDGHCLFGGCAEQLKVYGWEPARIFDTVTTGWGKVQDIATARDHLIGASFNLTTVLVCAVDINKISRTAPSASTSQISPFSHGQTVRKSFNKQKPRPTKTVQVKPIDEEYDTDDAANSFIPDVNDYESVFKPHRSLNRSPPPPDYDNVFKSPSLCRSPPPNPFSEPTSEDDVSVSSIPVSVSKHTTYHEDAEPSQIPVPVKLPERKVPSPLLAKASAPAPPITANSPTAPRPNRPSLANGQLVSKFASGRETLRRANSCKTDAGTQSESTQYGGADQLNRSESSLPDVVSRHRKATENHKRALSKATATDRYSAQTSVPYGDSEPPDEMIPSMTTSPVDLRLEEFLPMSYRNGGGKSQQTHTNVSEDEIVSSLTRNHEMVLTILKIRQRNLEIIYSLWHNQDLKCAIEGAVSMNDQAVLIDVLLAINKRPSLWNLDICVVLLPAIYDLLHSKYEMYMAVCCESLQLILKNFSSVIKTNVQWSSPTIGVDISKEERYAKCVKCYDNLISIRTFLLKRQTMQGKLGQSFRELQSMLYAIEK